MNCKIDFEKIEINTNIGKDNKIFNLLAIQVSEKLDINVCYFFSNMEKILLSQKYGYDFATIQRVDISKNIKSVELVKEENKYGIKQYIVVHFDIGYDLRIKNISADKFFILVDMFNLDKKEQAERLKNLKNVEKK